MAERKVSIYPSGATAPGYDADYTSMQSMFSSENGDLVTTTTNLLAEIRLGDDPTPGNWNTAEANDFIIDGWTTSTTYDVKVYTADDSRSSDGNWDSTAYRLETSGNNKILEIDNDDVLAGELNITFEGIQIAHLTDTDNNDHCVAINNFADHGVIIFSKCHLIQEDLGSKGVRTVDDTGTDYFINCVIDCHGSGGDCILLANASVNAYIYNCTLTGSADDGADRDSSTTATIINCAIFDNTSNDIEGTWTSNYNGSDDGDGTNPITPSGGNWDNELEDPDNGDFRMLNTGDMYLGSPISQFDDSNVPDDDIAGNPRNTGEGESVSIGAFEYVSAGSARALAGTIAAAAAASSGHPIRGRDFTASFAAAATLAGAPPLRAKGAVGDIAAISTFTGAAPLRLRPSIVGSLAAVSSFVGTVSRSPILVGSFAAISAFASATLDRNRELVGSFAGVSSLVGGALRRVRKVIDYVAAQSSFISARLSRNRPLQGAFASISNFYGDIVYGKDRILAGVIAVAAAFTGEITRDMRGLRATLPSQSALTGAAFTRVRSLWGPIAATGGMVGRLIRGRLLQGSFAAVASFTALIAQAGQVFMQGALAVTSAVSGTLVRARELSGSLAVVSTIAGVISRLKRLVDYMSCAASFTGTLGRNRPLQGSFASVSSFVGKLSVALIAGAKALAGIVAATSVFSATITVSARWVQAVMEGYEVLSGKFVHIVGRFKLKKEE